MDKKWKKMSDKPKSPVVGGGRTMEPVTGQKSKSRLAQLAPVENLKEKQVRYALK